MNNFKLSTSNVNTPFLNEILTPGQKGNYFVSFYLVYIAKMSLKVSLLVLATFQSSSELFFIFSVHKKLRHHPILSIFFIFAISLKSFLNFNFFFFSAMRSKDKKLS